MQGRRRSCVHGLSGLDGLARAAAWVGLTLAGACYQGIDGTRAEGGEGGSVDDAGDADDDDAGSDDDGAPPSCLDDGPAVTATRMRLLTRYEYDNTVRDLIGDTSQPARAFAPENKSGLFENDAEDHQVSKDVVRQYLDAAEDIARRAVDERMTALLPCDPAVDGEPACGHSFVGALLPRAFRRPPTAEEIAAHEALFDSALAEYGFADAIALELQAVLQSPQFLYRMEQPLADATDGAVVPVQDYEMASRLSYFLVASMPDDELFAAAADGSLRTVEEIEAHARRLLASGDAQQTLREFHRQWLGLGMLASVAKDATAFPTLDQPTFASDWTDSLQQYVAYVFADGGGTMEALFAAPEVFLSPELAAFYGATAQDPETGAWTMPGERAGLLTQPGLMGMLAYPDNSSPVARGVFVRKRFLCQELTPPPDVPIEPPSPDPNATTRERFEQHSADPLCAGCHILIDPIGFTFENYDGAGAWRSSENDKPIDASGALMGVTDPTAEGPVANAIELSAKLAASSDAQECIVEHWTTFALGRAPAEADECTMEVLQSSFSATGGDFVELMVSIATSDAFRFRVSAGGGA